MTALEQIQSKLYASKSAPPPTETTKNLPHTGRELVMSSAGEFGDLVYAMCVLKAQPGGPHTILLREHPGSSCKTSNKVVTHPEVFIPLALSQPYIKECRLWGPGDQEKWISSYFREQGYHNFITTLVRAHCRHGMSTGVVKVDTKGHEKWLDVTPDSRVNGRVLIARTPRWRNSFFPWRQIHETYGNRLLMLGVREEHEMFEREVGPVEFHECRDLLEAAQLIAGSFLWISNQTSLYAVAEGLKVRRILEVNQGQCDCIYTGGDVQHCIDGAVTLPIPGETFTDDLCVLRTSPETMVKIPPSVREYGENVSTMTVPPGGGWKAPGFAPCGRFESLRDAVMSLKKVDEPTARRIILDETHRQHPGFLGRGEGDDLRGRLAEALAASTA